jgi:hypothetical protein
VAQQKKKKPTRKVPGQRGKVPSRTCFVIMPFGYPSDRYYGNVFAPAVSAAGLEPIRADSLFRSTSIIGDIWRLTQEAAVLIADLSGKNPNVFYELGLAHAIGKPVILVSSSIEDIPFDLRSLRVLVYDKDNEAWGAELRERIVSSLRETLEDLPSAVPLPFVELRPVNRPIEDPVEYEFRQIREELRAIRLAQQSSYPTRAPTSYDPFPPLGNQAIVEKLWEALSPLEARWVTDEILAHIGAELWIGRRINAVKFVRNRSSLGLREAVEFVDRLRPIIDASKVSGLKPWP